MKEIKTVWKCLDNLNTAQGSYLAPCGNSSQSYDSQLFRLGGYTDGTIGRRMESLDPIHLMFFKADLGNSWLDSIIYNPSGKNPGRLSQFRAAPAISKMKLKFLQFQIWK